MGPVSYSELPDACFWRKCLESADFRFDALYRPAFPITPEDPVVTAGSCFAQKIGHELRLSNARFLDVEPLPPGMSARSGAAYGFGLYSARYGNIYTSAQLLQLVEDALSARLRDEALWQAEGRWYDGLRARLEPGGYASREILSEARLSHLRKVRQLLLEARVFIFTLGLTERWQHAGTGTVFPLFPGAVNRGFASADHVFHNSRVGEVVAELSATIALMRSVNPGLRFLFTVSPVPLMATATGGHVLAATARSKAVLRAAVDEILLSEEGCDYFPSYEIATANPLCRDAFDAGGREVRDEVVRQIMGVFFAAQPALSRNVASDVPEQPDTVCDEILLQAAKP